MHETGRQVVVVYPAGDAYNALSAAQIMEKFMRNLTAASPANGRLSI